MLWIVLGNLTNLEILNSQWFSTSNDEFGNFKPELEGKVEALPTDQVVDKVAQQYRKVPEKQILREKINLSNLIISGRDLGSPE